MIKKIQGYYSCYEEKLYTTDKAWEKGNPYDKDVISLYDLFEDFYNNKIEITIKIIGDKKECP